MTLRSTISIEIISRLQEEEKIQIAFPSQSIFMEDNVQSPKSPTMPNDGETILPSKEL
jgi:small-conductance mechanosensitive channel